MPAGDTGDFRIGLVAGDIQHLLAGRARIDNPPIILPFIVNHLGKSYHPESPGATRRLRRFEMPASVVGKIFLSDQEEHYLQGGAGDNGRLDVFLTRGLPELSRSRIQALIKGGNVLVDGVIPRPKDPVPPGAQIVVTVPAARPAETAAEDIPLTFLYEDEDLAVVDKPSGLVVHPGSGNPDGTLVNALLHHFGKLSEIGGVGRPGIVHRIDKETSGCLVVARNDFTHNALATQFSERQVSKQYLTVVSGIPDPPSGRVENHIGRNPQNRQKMAVLEPPAGKRAVTSYRVAAPRQKTALVVCDLYTGRTHQIRVHMKSLGHPLLGDSTYGRGTTRQPVDRLMLHAWKLGFTHPRDGRPMTFEAPAPEEFTPWTGLSPELFAT